jgi:sphingosine kinase
LTEDGHIAVDGEAMPFKEFHVEVHQALGTVLSPYGYYAAEFDMPSDKRKLPK